MVKKNSFTIFYMSGLLYYSFQNIKNKFYSLCTHRKTCFPSMLVALKFIFGGEVGMTNDKVLWDLDF